jgi:hypothetical protein
MDEGDMSAFSILVKEALRHNKTVKRVYSRMMGLKEVI